MGKKIIKLTKSEIKTIDECLKIALKINENGPIINMPQLTSFLPVMVMDPIMAFADGWGFALNPQDLNNSTSKKNRVRIDKLRNSMSGSYTEITSEMIKSLRTELKKSNK